MKSLLTAGGTAPVRSVSSVPNATIVGRVADLDDERAAEYVERRDSEGYSERSGGRVLLVVA